MNNQELYRQVQRLRDLFDRTEVATAGDIEVQSHWAKYLCVLTAGFLENSLVEVYSRYADHCASAKVASFARKSLSRIQNPNMTRFIEIAMRFSTEWGEELQQYADENGRKEAVDAIMANRHLIAHGRQSGISLVPLRNYFDRAIQVVEFLENQCAGATKTSP